MGGKPSAASTATTKPKSSGIATTTSSVAATEPTPPTGETTATGSRFGMSHAPVIIACIVTAAILATLGMRVQDVLLLIAGAGSIGAAVVVAAVTGGRRGGRMGRLMRAYLSSGN